MRNSIKQRAKHAIDLKFFNQLNYPEIIKTGIDLILPQERQYILRMLIKKPFVNFQIPDNVSWTKPLVDKAYANQIKMGINQPFCYLTIRHGIVTTKKDDEWHTDGFSETITHLPEQNYGWCDKNPTEYVVKCIKFPKDFDTSIYNVHKYIQSNINDKSGIVPAKALFCFDPYVIHRRPSDVSNEEFRTFVRVSFTPIEIADDSNHINPMLKVLPYNRYGLDFRNNLKEYGKYEKN